MAYKRYAGEIQRMIKKLNKLNKAVAAATDPQIMKTLEDRRDAVNDRLMSTIKLSEQIS